MGEGAPSRLNASSGRPRRPWDTRVVRLVAVALGALAVTATPLGAAASAQPSDAAAHALRAPGNGLPTRWFGRIRSLFIFDEHGTKTVVKTFAEATFTLTQTHPGSPRFANEYDYLARGTLTASYSEVSGDCTWKGSQTVPLKPSHGGIRIIVTQRRGKPPDTYYSWLAATEVGGTDPTINVKLACPKYTHVAPEPITWLGVLNHNRTSTGARSLRGTYKYHPAPVAEGFRTWCLTRKQSDLEKCPTDELKAIARVSGSSARAATRTLDGSASKGEITGYRWTFGAVGCTGAGGAVCAGSCKAVGPRPQATKTGARPTIKPLCTIRATLTVTDGTDEDSASVLVRVTPRAQGWKTPFSYRETHEPITLPWVKCETAGACKLELDGGVNTADPAKCPGQPVPGSQNVCPLRNGRTTWNAAGYTVATVNDPRGPFDGYSYVSAATLSVSQLGTLNKYLFPDAVTEVDGNNFYSYNKANGANVDGFLKALGQHEGLGAPGKPRTGHAQVTKEDLGKAGNDPRQEIEQLFAPAASDVQQAADRQIEEIDKFLQGDTCDHGTGCRRLNEIGKFDLYFFHPTPTSWTWDKTTITVT